MIKRRERDIFIQVKIPLPRRFWRRRKATDQARENMSAAQRKRYRQERGQLPLEPTE